MPDERLADRRHRRRRRDERKTRCPVEKGAVALGGRVQLIKETGERILAPVQEVPKDESSGHRRVVDDTENGLALKGEADGDA